MEKSHVGELKKIADVFPTLQGNILYLRGNGIKAEMETMIKEKVKAATYLNVGLLDMGDNFSAIFVPILLAGADGYLMKSMKRQNLGSM